MSGWRSLPFDLIRDVGDRLLATDDLDYFMSLRAVCRAWRSATEDPKADMTDRRFQLRRWVLLDERDAGCSDDSCYLFLNTTTGRFVRKALPRLGEFWFVTSTGGLLLLADRDSRQAVRVVNPFTASALRFKARFPTTFGNYIVTGYLEPHPPPTLVVASKANGREYSAKLSSRRFSVVRHDVLENARSMWGIADEQMLAQLGGIAASCPDLGPCFCCYYFVESAGEMLLVRHQHESRAMDVFKVDAERGVVEPTRCISSRALFLGIRCLSVQVDRFPGIDGNRIFYSCKLRASAAVCEYDLASGQEKSILHVHDERPLSLTQELARYCIDIPMSQLARAQACGGYGLIRLICGSK